MSTFFQMGGYAIYVWPSFAITFILLGLNVWRAVDCRRQAIRNLRRKLLMEENEPKA